MTGEKAADVRDGAASLDQFLGVHLNDVEHLRKDFEFHIDVGRARTIGQTHGIVERGFMIADLN